MCVGWTLFQRPIAKSASDIKITRVDMGYPSNDDNAWKIMWQEGLKGLNREKLVHKTNVMLCHLTFVV